MSELHALVKQVTSKMNLKVTSLRKKGPYFCYGANILRWRIKFLIKFLLHIHNLFCNKFYVNDFVTFSD